MVMRLLEAKLKDFESRLIENENSTKQLQEDVARWYEAQSEYAEWAIAKRPRMKHNVATKTQKDITS